ncbi:hypothetical protein UFOVP1151_26 [uncultured Caudovirales phage]|uniref:Uncharacterized protein n=1 Tax=uncultured Caudovirales phage TaxID=2100421 RepID=A0A6J5QVU7_9CAUD|nr:hypothetical protein UFOVP1151_26 [uncultured Caudovirales phage]
MLTLILISLAFLGGIYVGTRWSDKIKAVYFSIISQ